MSMYVLSKPRKPSKRGSRSGASSSSTNSSGAAAPLPAVTGYHQPLPPVQAVPLKQRRHPSTPDIDEDRTESTVQVEDEPSSIANFLLPNDPRFTPSINGRSNLDFEDVYGRINPGNFLDNGAFGDIFSVQHNNHEYAVKITPPSVLDFKRTNFANTNYDDLEYYCQEIKALLAVQDKHSRDNHNLLTLVEYFWNGRDIFLVTELLGVNVRTWISHQPQFTEEMARRVSKTILKAISFMHERNVVHRDLKNANILMPLDDSPRAYRQLKIVDFGLAHVLERPDEHLKDFCGSPGYIAPEVLQREHYRVEVDMFSFGCVLFRMLSAKSPWPSQDPKVVTRLTKQLQYRVDQGRWNDVTPRAKQLIRLLLTDRDDRLTALQALRHPWFQSEEDSVLHTDAVASPDNFSKAVAITQHLSTMPEQEMVEENYHFYHADYSIRSALMNLIAQRGYAGEIMSSEGDGICLKERTDSETLPAYVAQMPRYTEWECRILVEKIAASVQTFHCAGVAHRNLHVENILVDHRPVQQYEASPRDANVTIRGLQYALRVDQPLTGRVGRGFAWYAFTAPEIDSEFVHDDRVDLWSLGAVLYTLLCGIPPFRGEGRELKINKHRGIVAFDVVAPSPAAQDLVRRLLQVRPENRWSIGQVMQHEWMRAPDYELQDRDLSVTQILITDTLLTQG